MNKYYKKLISAMLKTLRVLRYIYRHLLVRPKYLWNYMRHYFDNDYIEKINFYDNTELVELLKYKSIIRIGDGEIHMHNGGEVLGYQKYNKRLANYLKKIISEYNDKSPYVLGIPQFTLQSNKILRDKNLINCWMPLKATIKTYFNRDAHYADAHAFYRESGFDNILRPILETHKIIMITGIHNVAMLESEKVNIHDKLDIDFITTTKENAFDDFDGILKRFDEWIVKNIPIEFKSLDDTNANDINNTDIDNTDIDNKSCASTESQINRDDLYGDINTDLQRHFDDFNKKYRVLVSAGPAGKAIVYELSKPFKTFDGGYICYDIGKGVETMYQENKVKNMIG